MPKQQRQNLPHSTPETVELCFTLRRSRQAGLRTSEKGLGENLKRDRS